MTNDAPDRDALVERLVRLAEKGPEVPNDGALSVKAAVRPLWRAEVRRRAARRYAAWGVGLAAAAAVIVILLAPQPNRPTLDPVARVELTRGALRITPDSNTITGGSILTTDDGSRAALRLRSGVSLRLDVATRIEIVSATAVALQRGAIYVDSGSAGELLEVRTPLGTARDIGTQFEVRSESGTLVVRVREGTVALSTSRHELRVDRGTQLSIASDGSRSKSIIAPHAVEWSWIHSVAPPFDIEGRSVVSFLAWVSRETGTPVRYESSEAERIANTTLLHGTLGELRPDEAPELILPSAGLEAGRDTDGTLVVGVMPR